MKCILCNRYHEPWMPCIHDDLSIERPTPSLLSSLNLSKPDPIPALYEPPKPTFDFLSKPEPILPPYEPPKPLFDYLPKPDPIIPSYEPPRPNFDFLSKPDPILPSYEPPKPAFDYLPKPDPIIPPPAPVYDLTHNLVGWKPELDNHINIGNGSYLDIEPGGFVRDPIGNLIGQMGPLNTIMPPSLPQMPDYGPPQSTPDVWNPGFSPIGPFG